MKKIIIAIAIIIVLVAIGWYCRFILGLASQRAAPEGSTLDKEISWEKEHGLWGNYDSYEKEEYTVKGYKDYELHVTLVKNPVETDKYVIISHGFKSNRYGAVKYVDTYMDLGFNCIIYDLRGHGANESTFCSYSVREGKDLAEIVHFFQEKLGRNAEIGLHGESLGAATTIASLKDVQNVSFAVADCGFSDIENVLEEIWRYSHIPTAIGPVMNQYAKLHFGIPISAMRPIDSLAKNQVPILFIHGEDDQYILPANSERMYEATKGKRDLLLVPKAGHAESVFVNKSLYTEKLKDFLSSLAS